MEDNQKEKPQEKPKSSCKCLWVFLIIFGVLIIGLGIFFAVRFFGGSKDINPNTGRAKDEEDVLMSKDELINYFVAETTVYPGFDKKLKTMAWDKPVVTVAIADQAPENAPKIIDDFITTFNRNSTTTQLQRISGDADIKVYFQKDVGHVAGSAGPSSGADYIIDHATIRMSERSTLFDESLAQIFSHEMFHVLGFTGHYDTSTCRLMSPDTCGSHLSINEEKLIQMLYSSGLPIESDEAQIRAFFQNWSPN